MDQELQATANSARLRLILSRWRDWATPLSVEPHLVRKLGGLSNDNFLVRSGDRRFVVRLNNDRFELGVDRNVERRILADIAGEPFAPAVIYTSEDCLVTPFIEGEHPRTPDPGAMGRLFRQIHAVASNAGPVFDAWSHLEAYMSRVAQPAERLQRCFNAVMSRRSDTPVRTCLCHNDLLFENMLDTGSGLVVIDWEYARRGDPAFDIAVFAHTYDLDEATITQLLAAYDTGDTRIQERIGQHRDIYALIEICWWLIRGRDLTSLSGEIHRLAGRLGVV